MITLYFFLDFFVNNKITYKRLFIAGLCAGCVLISKYTLLGFWFGFMACIFFNLIFNKQYKKSIISCLIFLLGMSIPFIISLIYMGINGGIKEYFNVYFYINMTSYGNLKTGLIMRMLKIASGFLKGLCKNGIIQIILLVLMPICLLKMNISKSAKISIFITFVFTVVGIYWGLVYYIYYFMPIQIFMLIILISVATLINKYIKFNKWSIIFLISISIITTVSLSYFKTNYKICRYMKKEEMPQYKLAQIINEEENPTLINEGELDCGIYTMSNIIPSTYFFMRNNISYDKYPRMEDSLKEYIKEKSTKFIVYYTTMNLGGLEEKEPELFNNYDLITYQEQTTRPGNFTLYLFKMKNL